MLRSELRTIEVVRPARLVAGELRVPGDKSIAHRALMLAAVADGECRLEGLPESEDVRATIACLRSLGVHLTPVSPSPLAGPPAHASRAERAMRAFEASGGLGRGFHVSPAPSEGGPGWGFASPHGPLDCANSGTTMRLLLGLLAGTRVTAILDGDESLRRRPMARVIDPLRKMGARIDSDEGHAPVFVTGTALQGRYHVLPIPSAQIKSAILLAGLSASGPTTVVEPVKTRDHTERLLQAMGAEIRSTGSTVELRPSQRWLRPLGMTVPGDFSSAAFWMAAAALRPDWSISLRDVGLNPTRTAFARLLDRMGAEVWSDVTSQEAEPVGSLRVVGRPLQAIDLAPDEVAGAIDELPALMVVATQAHGVTIINGAGELRVKESDRIAAMVEGLRRMGARIDERPDGVSVYGPTTLHGAAVDTRGDHRIAMALAIAALVADGDTAIDDAECVAVSYPGFFHDLREVVDVA